MIHQLTDDEFKSIAAEPESEWDRELDAIARAAFGRVMQNQLSAGGIVGYAHCAMIARRVIVACALKRQMQIATALMAADLASEKATGANDSGINWDRGLL
jgi:hypothetical protein